MSFDKKISDIFGINQLPEERKNLPVVVEGPVSEVSTEDATVDSDYNYARKNIRDLIERGMIDLEDIASIAKQSEAPRAYEVMNGILKTILDANKDLLSIADTKKKIKLLTSNALNDPKTVNNNLIVAPTNKINQLLAKMEEDEKKVFEIDNE